jgi:hypothetical protein
MRPLCCAPPPLALGNDRTVVEAEVEPAEALVGHDRRAEGNGTELAAEVVGTVEAVEARQRGRSLAAVVGVGPRSWVVERTAAAAVVGDLEVVAVAVGMHFGRSSNGLVAPVVEAVAAAVGRGIAELALPRSACFLNYLPMKTDYAYFLDSTTLDNLNNTLYYLNNILDYLNNTLDYLNNTLDYLNNILYYLNNTLVYLTIRDNKSIVS